MIICSVCLEPLVANEKTGRAFVHMRSFIRDLEPPTHEAEALRCPACDVLLSVSYEDLDGPSIACPACEN